MKVYARIEHGSVVELLATEGDIVAMFHPELHWIDVTTKTGIMCGWLYDGLNFVQPDHIVSAMITPAAPEFPAPEPSSNKVATRTELDPAQTSIG